MSKIPITVLAGFLGSGKTTLLNQLLKTRRDENVVVIMNEFGDVGIDHELVLTIEEERIFQINNGCMCCILREDLLDMFQAILTVAEESKWKIDQIIIETSGLADPSPIIQTIIRTPLLNQYFSLDSVLTLVDAGNALYQLKNYPEAVEQVAFSDRAYLTKTDITEKDEVAKVKQELADINPFIDIIVLDSQTEQYKNVIGLNLFDGSTQKRSEEKDIDHMIENLEHHHGEQVHSHNHSAVDSFVIAFNEPIEEGHFIQWLEMLVTQYGMNLIRYKGILNVLHQEKQVILQGVNRAFRVAEGEEWKEEPKTKIVLIGKNLPEKEITALLVENVV